MEVLGFAAMVLCFLLLLFFCGFLLLLFFTPNLGKGCLFVCSCWVMGRWLVVLVQGGGSPAWVDVPERSKSAFMELKRRKVHRYVIFKIDDRMEEIVVEKTGSPGESYDDFTASLPADDCRYAVYDLDFVSDDNCRKSKIFFISWSVIPSPTSACSSLMLCHAICWRSNVQNRYIQKDICSARTAAVLPALVET